MNARRIAMGSWAGLLFTGFTLALVPRPVQGMNRLDFSVADENGYQIGVASTDARDVIVSWAYDYPSPVVRCRMMRNQEWTGAPFTLGAGRDPIVFTDLLGGFHVMYVSGTTIVSYSGAPGDLEGPTYVGAGTGAINGPCSASMAPDGTLFLAWMQNGSFWITRDAPGYDGWETPSQVPAAGGWSVSVVPRLVDGSWQPRIYYISNSAALVFRQFDGTAWEPESVTGIDSLDFEYRAILLASGRHAVFFNQAFFCGIHHYEENATGDFQPEPALLSEYGGGCTISDIAPMPFCGATDETGTLHVARYEACWEEHDGDIWGCAFNLIWQWRTEPEGSWTYVTPSDFPGGDAAVVAMGTSRVGTGGPVFAYGGYGFVRLRIMNQSPSAVSDPPAIVFELRAVPNPASRAVRLEWTGPALVPALLQIFDSGGRLVRAFEASGGEHHQIDWDGLNRDGVPVAAGLYQARVTCGQERRAIPIVWIR